MGIAAVAEYRQDLGGYCKVGNCQEDPQAALEAGGHYLKFAAILDDHHYHSVLALIADVAVGRCHLPRALSGGREGARPECCAGLSF